MVTWSFTSSLYKGFVPYQLIKMTEPVPAVHHSLESVLSILKHPENIAVAGIPELLNIYTTAKNSLEKIDGSGEVKQYPLIILEGLDGSGKSTVGRLFAQKINGKPWQTPPKSIQHLRKICDDNQKLHTAYYSLGNYIAALEVAQELRNHPVVMDRYWHSTTAFGLAQAVYNIPGSLMPPEGDKIYSWPEDLFKPDIVIFLDVDEKIRLQRISRRKEFTHQENLLRSCEEFRNNVILAYRNMRNPEVVFVNGNHSLETECSEIYEKVKSLLPC